jgi:iron complex outermembrane recepter protein
MVMRQASDGSCRLRRGWAAGFQSASPIVLALVACPALAQESLPAQTVTPVPAAAPAVSPHHAAQAQDSDDDDPEIVVVGSRAAQRGAVIGDIKPELQLGPADIRALGVSSISDILTELGPQLTSGRGGTPVVLLNGKRISGMNEIRDIPAEAIARLDILPEEVALKYGYTADQKVLNVVLRKRFKAYTGELDGGLATGGGGLNGQVDANYIRIRGNGRLNLDLKYSQSAALFENERGVTPTPAAQPYALAGNVVDAEGTVFGVLPGAGAHTPTPADFSATANTLDDTAFRTLTAASRDFSANAVYHNDILGHVAMTLNGRVEIATSDGDNGLPTLALALPAGNAMAGAFTNQPVTLYRSIDSLGPLTQSGTTITSHAGLTLNADLGKAWHWSFIGNYDAVDTDGTTLTGLNDSALVAAMAGGNPPNPYGPLAPGLLGFNPANRTHSLATTYGGDLLLYGSLFKLPAGAVTTSLKGAFTSATLDSNSALYSTSLGALVSRSGHSLQDTTLGQINLDIPVFGGKRHIVKALGDLTLNANAGVQNYSDFGRLVTLGYGLHWSPVDPLTLIVSATSDHAAPSVSQLTNPQTVSPGHILLNPLTGQNEIVTQISGGNAGLRASTRHVLKLEANLKPLTNPDLTLNATFTRINIDNPIMTPTLTEAFAAEENDTIDLTPVNFTRSESDQLRLGLNFTKTLKSSRKMPPGGWAAVFGNRRGGGEDGGGRDGGGTRGEGNGGGGRRGGGGGGFGGGRFTVSLYDTITLHDTLQVSPTGPTLNLLHGDATGSSGGQVRHDLTLQLGLTRNGFGARLTGSWQSPTEVVGAVSSSTLHFGSLATANLRLFVNLGQQPGLVKQHPWLRGTRLTFSVTNLLDTRQRVTDATGSVPLSYQPAYLDAMGRTLKIGLRKLF